MRGTKLFKRITVCALVLLLAVPFTAMSAQMQEGAAAQIPEKVFKPEELEQLLASVALYPDTLLAQVLTAAAYPLEVVAADRFVKENPGLKGEALLEIAKTKDWEPSVKAMLEFPDVLAMMDEQLEWTEKLGDAFLAQRSDCMDAVQRLRQKAYAQGNLATTQEQVINVEPQTRIIIIEPANPEIVYVPVYDSAIIYGDWEYPAYPPYYFYPRRDIGVSFFSGVFVGAFWGAWDCNWHNRDVYVHIDHYNHFTKTSYTGGDQYRSYGSKQSSQPWRYDVRHRESVKHKDSFTAVRPSTPEPLKYDKVAVRTPTVDLRENVRPSANGSRSNARDQARIKRMPAAESRGGAAGRVNAKPALPVIARPASDDPRRKKDNDNISAAKSRGRIEHLENDGVRPNRRIDPPALKDPDVLREGLMRAGGR
jgi:hypothetical protein